jgi:hypothetical protein
METVEKQTTVFPPFPQPLLLLTKSVKDVLITKRKGCLDNQHTEGRPYDQLEWDFAVVEVHEGV